MPEPRLQSQQLNRVPREGESLRGHGSRTARPDYVINPDTGCWDWQKAKSQKGYPSQRQYRDYYRLAYGEIPADHDVHHRCKNVGCVNPDHLEAIHRRDHDVEHFLHERTGLTLDDLKEMRRRMRDVNQSVDELAAEFGVSSETGHVIKRGERWVDLIGEGGPVVVDNPRDCLNCGATVERKKRDAIYCSVRCRQQYNDKRSRRRARAMTGERSS